MTSSASCSGAASDAPSSSATARVCASSPSGSARVERFYAPSRRQGGAAGTFRRRRARGFAVPGRRLGPRSASLCSLEPRRRAAVGGDLHLVGFGFSESFAESGRRAARIALGRRARRGARIRRRGPASRLRPPAAAATCRATRSASERAQRAQHDARERSRRPRRAGSARGGTRRESATAAAMASATGPQARAHDRDRGGSGERRGAVARGKRRIVRDRGERSESRVGHRRTSPVEGLLEDVRDERRGPGGDAPRPRRRAAGGGIAGRSTSPGPTSSGPFTHQADSTHEERPSARGARRPERPRRARGRGRAEEPSPETSRTLAGRHPLLLVVNGRASGIDDPHADRRELPAASSRRSARTRRPWSPTSEEELWDAAALRRGAWPTRDLGRRRRHAARRGERAAARTCPSSRSCPPAGPTTSPARWASRRPGRRRSRSPRGMAATPLDALRVATPDRFVYALEAVSAGFQAEARAGYSADNSADLRQGLRALVRAVRASVPTGAVNPPDDRELRSSPAAQLFFSNLPYFGFGFEVDPGADPADGRFEAIRCEARGRAPAAATAGRRPARPPPRQARRAATARYARAAHRAAAPGCRRGPARHHDGHRERGACPPSVASPGWRVRACTVRISLAAARSAAQALGGPRRVASAALLVLFSLAAVGAGAGRALTTTYLPVLLERIEDAPSLIGAVMTVTHSPALRSRSPSASGPTAAAAACPSSPAAPWSPPAASWRWVSATAPPTSRSAGGGARLHRPERTDHRAPRDRCGGRARTRGRPAATSAQEIAGLAGAVVAVAIGGALIEPAPAAAFALAARRARRHGRADAALTRRLRLGERGRARRTPTARASDARRAAPRRRPRGSPRADLWVFGYAALPAFFVLYAEDNLGLSVGVAGRPPARLRRADRARDGARRSGAARARAHAAARDRRRAARGRPLAAAPATSLPAAAVPLRRRRARRGLVTALGFPYFARFVPEGEAGRYSGVFFAGRAVGGRRPRFRSPASRSS